MIKSIPLPNNVFHIPTKGDILELHTGEKATFIEMKRTNWSGMIDGRRFKIPLMLNSITPFAKSFVGTDKSLKPKSVKEVKMNAGDLFCLPNRKETFMFVTAEGKQKRGRKMFKAIDLASGQSWNIDDTVDIVKIDFNKIKREAKTQA